jgi:hypothetical protein
VPSVKIPVPGRVVPSDVLPLKVAEWLWEGISAAVSV